MLILCVGDGVTQNRDPRHVVYSSRNYADIRKGIRLPLSAYTGGSGAGYLPHWDAQYGCH